MRRYETTYILRPNLGEDQLSEIINKTNANIEADGSVINIDQWGLKKLAYEIKKETQGYYVYVDFAATSAAVDEMERIFRIDDRVIRYLTLKLAESIDQDTIQQETERIANQDNEAEEEEATTEETEEVAKSEVEATE